MAEDTGNSQSTSATSGGDLESRIAALEKRFDQFETVNFRRLEHLIDITNNEISSQAKRLSRLEARHDNLRRYTTDVPESWFPTIKIWGWIVSIIVLIYILTKRH